jgi:hypothetical protein
MSAAAPRSHSLVCALAALFLGACDLGAESSTDGGSGVAGEGGAGATAGGEAGSAIDASSASSTSSTSAAGGGGGGGAPSAIAPEGTIPGEQPGLDGDNAVGAFDGSDAVLRVTSAPGEHLHFFLAFDGDPDTLELSVERYEDGTPRLLGVTDAGLGLRTLAVFDPAEPRTYWVRVHTSAPSFEGTLTITRTPFEDAPSCAGDCDRLMQLPLPIEPGVDGYANASSTVFRYQFGRRDLVMLVRHAGQRLASRGIAPFVPEDLSQWDGQTPGVDVGAPRHASHKRGRDVDVSIYGADGQAPWRSYCTTEITASGRECLPGTVFDYDGALTAQLYGGFLQSGRVTMSFLDAELIDPTIDGAIASAAADTLEAALVPLYSDGVHLQHWPNHDNHLHVRVSEDPTFAAEAFEAP